MSQSASVSYCWIFEIESGAAIEEISSCELPVEVSMNENGNTCIQWISGNVSSERRERMEVRALRLLFDLIRRLHQEGIVIEGGKIRLGVFSPSPITFFTLPSKMLKLAIGVGLDVEIDFYSEEKSGNPK